MILRGVNAKIMTVYIEYVIVDNMVINALILLATKRLLKANSNKIRILFSSLLGTAIALMSPLFSSWISFIIKIPLAICMLILAFNVNHLKQLFVYFLTFLLITFAFGGSCFAVMQMFGIKTIIQTSISYEYKYPIGAVLLICITTYISLKNIITYIFQKHKNSNYEYKVVLENGCKKICIDAFLDTGNKICVDGKTVTIINYKTFNSLFPKLKLSDVLLKKELNLKNQKYVEIESIGNAKQKILTFEIDKIYIEKKEITNAKIGLSLFNFDATLNCDAIISNKLLGD